MPEITDKHIERLKNLITKANTSLKAAEELLLSIVGEKSVSRTPSKTEAEVTDKVIEGIFNGQHMVADDGKVYPIQANYASKSRLVQGDRMKLTINTDGAFLYKQIQPTPRTQVVGLLMEKGGRYHVQVDKKSYHVLSASVTHHKIQPGDQISVTIPAENPQAEWAAIEAPL